VKTRRSKEYVGPSKGGKNDPLSAISRVSGKNLLNIRWFKVNFLKYTVSKYLDDVERSSCL